MNSILRNVALALTLLAPLSAFAGWNTSIKGSQDLFALWGNTDDLYAVGANGTILHSPGADQDWSAQQSGVTTSLFSVWGTSRTGSVSPAGSASRTGSASAEILYAAGAEGTILRSTNGGKTWVRLATSLPLSLRAIWGSGPNDVYIVGEQGTILHSTDGEHFIAQPSGVEVSLNGIWGSGPNDVYAVGEQGTILHSADGQLWSSLNSGTNELLRGVWGFSAEEIFVVGYHRTILHSTDGGLSFSACANSGEEWLSSVWGSSKQELYAAGARGVLLRSTDGGSSWEPQLNDTLSPLYAMWGSATQQINIVGKGGTLLTLTHQKPRLLVDASAEDAEVKIDGVAVGGVPVAKKLAVGRHFVELSCAGFKPYSQWVELQSDGTLPLSIQLVPEKATPLRIVGAKGAQILLDGQPKGVAPLTIDKVTLGQHVLTLKQAGFLDWTQAILIPEEGLVLSPALTAMPRVEVPFFLRPKNLYLASAGMVALSLVPVSLGFSELQKANHAQEAALNEVGGDFTALAQEYRLHRDRMQRYGFWADGMFLTAGAAALTGLTMNQRLKDSTLSASLSPAGVSVRLKF